MNTKTSTHPTAYREAMARRQLKKQRENAIKYFAERDAVFAERAKQAGIS